MKKALTQKEIDAVLEKARNASGLREESDGRVIQPCDFRSAGQMSERYARFMTTLFEAFARSLSNSMGAYLRSRFEMVLSSVEQMPVREFLAEFHEGGSLAVLSLQPGNTAVLLQVDTALVFPIIDVLLGGYGTPLPQVRAMTEIDEDIMGGVAQIICRQLEATWQPMGIAIRIDRQQKAASIQNVFSPNEKLTSLAFEARLNETVGAINLSFPTSFASAMLRQVSADPRHRSRVQSGRKPDLRERVLDCVFDSAVGIANLRIPLRDLLALRPGGVLNLRCPARNPARFILAGHSFFEAAPVRSGQQRAAQLLRPSRRSLASEE